MLLSHLPTQAADYYWDTDGATAGFGTAGGTWLNPTPGGTTGWSADSTGASAIGSVTTATGGHPVFSAPTRVGLATGTVDIGAAVVNVGGLRFGKASGDITLTGGDIVMAGGDTLIQASSGGGSVTNTHTINNDLSKTSGTLRFGTQNTGSEHYIMNGVLSGGFGLDSRMVNNSGVLELNGLNTFTGNVSITTGQINANTLADSGVASSLGAGSALGMGGGAGQNPRLVYTGSNATSTNRTLTVNANGIAGIIAQDGALDLSGDIRSNTGASTWNLFLSGTANTGTNTISGVMQDNGSGNLAVQVKNFGATGVTGEAAFWEFTGNNTYTGNTTVANGSTLKVSGAGQLGGGTYSSTLTINDTSTFHWDGDNLQVLDGTVQGSGTGGILATGAGQLRMLFDSTNITFSGPVTVDGGSLQFRNTADLKGFTPNNLNVEGGGALAIQSSVGGSNRTSLNNKTWNFDNGGGTLTFNGGNHLFQGGGNTHNFNVTAAGSGSLIQSISGGFMNMQGSGNIEFDVADGAEDRDLTLSATFNNGKITKDGAGTLAITGSHGGNYLIDINAGTLEVGNASTLAGGTFTAAIQNDATFKYNSSSAQTISGVISGTGALTKDNSGNLTLSGANTYSGNTSVSGGTLALSAADNNIANSAAIDVASGATLDVSGITNGFALASGQTLSGAGTVLGDMTIASGSVLSPGNSPGTLSTGAQTWNDGGSYLWEINASDIDGGGSKGADPGWDWLDITGTLDLTNLSAGGFTIDIDSLAGAVAGDALGFDTWTKGNPGDVDYSFIIATASGGITDFSADKFSFDSSGFTNGPSWDWQIVLSGSDLVLEAYAVPEPSSTALLGLGGLALMLRRKRSA